ncbi:hemerythrin [Mycolicibacterium cyprinidarum]|uniref:Hemerythrin n=1 Tax=Mycolicibacterium cyprinidarum TaxID=2860311 RepID=A0ABQ4V9Y0_9MYCO|nr:hemerythrin [Mycolicibacterium sp. NGTWSNA01]GJF19374.1 hemerythrin [Mycolicibacterium sp. NGTWS0302]GJF19526.1 hemerythrin [Mycolicibacterium sp. NGTWS1803]
MPDEALSVALEREHREIDSGIASFVEMLDEGSVQHEPLLLAMDALRRHIYAEETFLFPPIRKAGLVMPVFVMMREHGQLWRTMDVLAGQLADGADTAQLRLTCSQLLGQLDQHNAKEEPVIYPHADTDLPAPVNSELAKFLETGQTPASWVCQQAVQ